MIKKVGLDDKHANDTVEMLQNMYKLFVEKDALLIEINPYAEDAMQGCKYLLIQSNSRSGFNLPNLGWISEKNMKMQMHLFVFHLFRPSQLVCFDFHPKKINNFPLSPDKLAYLFCFNIVLIHTNSIFHFVSLQPNNQQIPSLCLFF